MRSNAHRLTQGQTRWSVPLPSIRPNAVLVSALARAMVAGDSSGTEQIAERCQRTLGRPWPWLMPLAQRYRKTFAGKTRPRLSEVVLFLRNDRGLSRAWQKHAHELAIATWLPQPDSMQPLVPFAGLNLPALTSLGELAAWLALEPAELAWFTDRKGLTGRAREVQLQHYTVHLQPKRSGGVRVVEAPKLRLKQMQRTILHKILDRVPAHGAAHGFVRGRSVATFAEKHAGQLLVVRIDLAAFFPSIRAARVEALFRSLGYPELVAQALTGLCTTASPRLPWQGIEWKPEELSELRRLYARPHLPQGAATSPALANLSLYRADCRLSALAASVDAHYTRYADDLAFSGGARFARAASRFCTEAAAILAEEGYSAAPEDAPDAPGETAAPRGSHGE